MSLLKDERGQWSAARVLLTGWLLQTAAYAWYCVLSQRDPSSAALALDSGVAVALISWAAGPRIAQYIGGQVGSVASAVANAKILKRRASGEYEESR